MRGRALNGTLHALGRSSARHRALRHFDFSHGLPVGLAVPLALLLTAIITVGTATVVSRWT
ncbi:MAG TPA: hypothetical protein VMT88_10335 [Actinomycetes bacterium]|nr:hypothetical protein [Actinomycetes bacterium]